MRSWPRSSTCSWTAVTTSRTRPGRRSLQEVDTQPCADWSLCARCSARPKAEAHTVATLRAALRKSEAERLAALGQVEDLREKLAAPALADEEKYARIGRMVVQLVKDYDLNRLVVQLPHPSPMCPCAECQGRFDNLGKGKP